MNVTQNPFATSMAHALTLMHPISRPSVLCGTDCADNYHILMVMGLGSHLRISAYLV